MLDDLYRQFKVLADETAKSVITTQLRPLTFDEKVNKLAELRSSHSDLLNQDTECLLTYVKLKKETEEEVEKYKQEINTIFETDTLDPEWVRLFDSVSNMHYLRPQELRNCLFTLLDVNRCSRNLLIKKCLDLEERLGQISSERRPDELCQEHVTKIIVQDTSLLSRIKELESELSKRDEHDYLIYKQCEKITAIMDNLST
jgi:hypothetical protein